LARSREPLHRPLGAQHSLRTRREDLGGRTHLVGAAALHPILAVGQRGKFGLRRYEATTGRKRPLFDACRQIYPENFGQGLHSGRRREAPRARDPRILVVPLKRLPHSGEIVRLPLLHDRPPGLASEGQAPKFGRPADMCPIRRFKFNRQ
jgi:hypothetical protein